MEEIKYKKCSKCGEEKELNTENFYRDKSKKDGFRYSCKECQKIMSNEYKARNKEKVYKQQREYKEKNKIKIAEQKSKYDKEYRAKNKEKIARYQEQYIKENKEKLAIYRQQYREENKKYFSEYNKQYFQSEQGRKNKAKSNQNRRARKAQLPSTLTTEEYEDNLKYFNHSCAYCGCELDEDNHHMEHVVPISKGGGTTQENIIPSCESCNLSKHAKTLADWYRFSDDFSIEKLAQVAKHLAQFTDWVVSGDE